MNFILLVFILCLALFTCQVVNSKSCPAIYLRFSKDHTYCKHSTCRVIKSGVTEQEKKIILDLHNSYRNKIALGQETTPAQHPQAADMVQMEWDDELARIAQAHANLCKFDHDSPSQRQVEHFRVGQNLFYISMTQKMDWSQAAMWYTTEIKYYFPQNRQPYTAGAYPHLTQMIWAETWKVGCGASVYYDNYDRVDKVLYTCNYGPAGNWIGDKVYTAGRPCSQCPKNTRCSSEYQGLCKSVTADGPQKNTSRNPDDFFLYCDFSDNEDRECKNVKISGPRPFETRKIYSGEYKTVILNGGESITINLGKAKDNRGICPFVYGSFGPNRDGDAKRSAVSIGFASSGITFGDPIKIDYGGSDFWPIGIHMQYDGEMESTIKLEAYSGAAPQYFSIKSFGIGKGKCPKF